MLILSLVAFFQINVANAVSNEKPYNLKQEATIARGSIQVAVPSGWGVDLSQPDSGPLYDMIVLYPEGIKTGWKKLFGDSRLPLNNMSVNRFAPEKLKSLTDLLEKAKLDGDRHWPGRKTLELKIEKIGNYDWFIHVHESQGKGREPIQEWRGRVNVGTTPYLLMIQYEKSKKDSLGAKMLAILPTIRFNSVKK